MPFADLQSPRSQEFANAPSPDDEEALFTQGFTDLAYKALAKGAPTLRSSVITFRDLEKDVAKGEAVGAFIVRHGTEIVYVPVVLVDNAVKPLDVFYARTVDRFYPLTPQWLDRVDRETVNPMGRAMDAPKNVPTDVDLRSIVIPPTLGRFSYAEVENTKLAFTRVMRELREPSGSFLACVKQAPNHLKVAMAEGLRRQPRALSLMVEQYGVSALTDALSPTQEKSASSQETPVRHDVRMYSASMPVQEMQRQLGAGEAAHAYSHIRKHGFYIQDTRKSHNALAASGAERLALTTPTATGLYRVYLHDGSCKVAAVIVNPRSCMSVSCFYGDTRREPTNILVLFQDGSYAQPSGILAEALTVSQGEFESFFLSRAQALPSKVDECGVIGHFYAMSADFTEPQYAREIQRGERASTFRSGFGVVCRVTGKIGGIKALPHGLLYGEDSFWWPVGEQISSSMFPTDPRVISTLIDAQLTKEGAVPIRVKVSSDQGFIVGREVLYGPEAIVKVASVYGLNIDDATAVLETVKTRAPVRLWAKTAEPAPAPAPPPQDPNAMPMDPAMMGPPMPPPPSGMDLAITEKTQLIQQQILALQQQAMMLQEVQMRAQGIDGSGGMIAAPQAALGVMGAPPATVGGAPAIAPMGSMPGMLPQMGQPQMGMQPQMGQPQMGQPQMGMGMQPQMGMNQPQPGMPGTTPGIPQMGGMADPNQMGGMMDPNQMGMQAPPPQPVMSETPTADTIANMIDPKFLQDASLLGDPRVFDAAAVASLAKPRALREIFRNYAPTLDAALDKLGRTLILLYTQASELRDTMGDEAYQRIEQQARDTFRVLGDTLITLEEHGAHIPDGNSPTR